MTAQTVAEKLRLEKGQHELRLGKSFDRNAKNTFHTVRYDFKPASVDTNQESKVVITDDNAVTVTVPHVQGAGTTHTVYKGNKRPLNKECVLIINHDTGEIVLEKLSSAIQLKKTRMERQEIPSMRISSQRPVTPIDKTRVGQSRAPVKPYPSLPQSKSHDTSPNQQPSATTSADDLFPSTQSFEAGIVKL